MEFSDGWASSRLDVTQKMAIKKAPFDRGLLKIAIGAEDEIRTRDFLLGKEVQRAQHP